MATSKKNILGIPYFNGNSLMQDVILLYTLDGKTVRETSTNVVLIEDIWEDLKTNEEGPRTLKVNGDYSVELKISGAKNNPRKLFFYKIKYSNIDPESVKEFTYIDLPIPQPKARVFDLNFEESESDTQWSKYWKSLMKTSEDNSFNTSNALGSINKSLKTKYMEYQKEDGTFSGEVMPVDSGLWERENPYDNMGGLLASFW